jgi:hypothetical protein
MNALCINLKQRIGRKQIGGFGFSNSFLDLSIKKGENRLNAQSVRVPSKVQRDFNNDR